MAGPRPSTLPVQVYNYIDCTGDPPIAGISTLLIVLTGRPVLLVKWPGCVTRLM